MLKQIKLSTPTKIYDIKTNYSPFKNEHKRNYTTDFYSSFKANGNNLLKKKFKKNKKSLSKSSTLSTTFHSNYIETEKYNNFEVFNYIKKKVFEPIQNQKKLNRDKSTNIFENVSKLRNKIFDSKNENNNLNESKYLINLEKQQIYLLYKEKKIENKNINFEIKCLMNEIEKNKNYLLNLQNENKNITNTINLLQNTNNDNKQKISFLTKEINFLQNENNNKKSLLIKLDEKIKKLTLKYNNLINKFNNINSKLLYYSEHNFKTN
jgi:hypothetical protein